MSSPIRFTCWTCDSVRTVTDKLDGCCYECLLALADEFNGAVIAQMRERLPALIERRNAYGDQIADMLIVSKNPIARAAAIEWRNFRKRHCDDDDDDDEALPDALD